MTEAARPPVARSRLRRRARRVLDACVTTLAVTASVLSSVVVFALESSVPGQEEIEPTWHAGIGFLVALGVAIALIWRHEHPMMVTGIAIVPPVLLLSDSLAALIALAALAASRRDRVLWAGTIIVFVATALALHRDTERHHEDSFMQVVLSPETPAGPIDVPLPAVTLIAAVMTAIPVGVGLWRSTRRDLSRRDVKEQELQAEVTRQEERTRIAREMHDVLGHRLSLLSLQAGALEVNTEAGSTGTTEAAQTVRTTAKQSLDDLRQVIGVLREGHDLGAHDGEQPERAQPTLTDIPDLITESRRGGLTVNTTVLLDDVSSAPASLGTATYRIIQESLTNALRHAPGVATDVSVRGGPGTGLTVEVSNPLPDASAPANSPGSGTGLTGISERASLLGGNASAGPTEEQTFVVSVWLPWARPS